MAGTGTGTGRRSSSLQLEIYFQRFSRLFHDINDKPRAKRSPLTTAPAGQIEYWYLLESCMQYHVQARREDKR